MIIPDLTKQEANMTLQMLEEYGVTTELITQKNNQITRIK